MGYDLARVETTYANKDNHDWLASAHGTDATDSITLDNASLLAAFPDGEAPAGVEISRDPGTGKYIVGIRAADAGAAPPVTASDRPGFLYHSTKVKAGYDPVGALLWHGEVIAARVPLGAAGVAPDQANHPFCRIV